MQDRNRPIRLGGRSSIDRLPTELREAVDAAIADGATTDEITARIRAGGGDCSRSAVGRYAKNMRKLIRQQHEADRAIEAWVRAIGECPEGHVGLLLIKSLRTMVLSTIGELSQREEAASTQDLVRLALVVRRIEGSETLRLERERAAAKSAPGGAERQGGLSPETVAAIRAEVEGRPPPPPPSPGTVTSVPVDPRTPADPHSSDLIPLNPG